MKKKVGNIYGKPIVVGDENEVTKNEVHFNDLKDYNIVYLNTEKLKEKFSDLTIPGNIDSGEFIEELLDSTVIAARWGNWVFGRDAFRGGPEMSGLDCLCFLENVDLWKPTKDVDFFLKKYKDDVFITNKSYFHKGIK